MGALERISEFAGELTAIRRDIHAHPEIGFEEVRTSALVAEKLASWGIEVHRNIGKTGVVGVLKGKREGGRRIGLRADMDALPIHEQTNLPYASRNQGVMHACGHDGHTTMLLGAARYLAETRDFAGTVHFIFQPAEEGLGGARAMMADGLFDRFPCDEIYGLHNYPAASKTRINLRTGPAMSSADFFDIVIHGKGSHGAYPHQSKDPIMIATTMAQAMQTIVSRNVSPLDTAVVSITQIHAGAAYNVVPETAELKGTIRTFSDSVRSMIRTRMHEIATGIAAAYGATADVKIDDKFSVLENSAEPAAVVTDVAREMLGADAVNPEAGLQMGSEDFSDMLKARPGAYFFVAQGEGPALHNPGYNFNDDILPVGAAMLARIAEKRA